DRVGRVEAARGVVDRIRLSIVFELDEVLFVDVVHATNGVPAHRGIRHWEWLLWLTGFLFRWRVGISLPRGPARAVHAPKSSRHPAIDGSTRARFPCRHQPARCTGEAGPS